MSFKQAVLNKDFVMSAELPLTPDSTAETMLADARSLQGPVDGFLLTDNQYGQPHMAPAAAASILQREGLSPVMQITCRNRNRIALLGELLGARALGIDSLMLVRGGKLPDNYKPRPKAVMDMNARELIATARRMNDDEQLGSRGDFLICASATAHDPEPGWQPDELGAKADAGAQLMFTQLCFDAGLVRRYIEALISQQWLRRFSVIVSIAAIQSVDMAMWLRNNRHRAIVPDSVIERLRAASDPSQEGISICTELAQEFLQIPGVSGMHFSLGSNLAAIPEIIQAATPAGQQ